MSVTVRPYDLNDAALFSGTGDGMLVWEPAGTVIVLGQSNTPEKSLITDKVEADSIPVTKRPTGGEAVVLTPRMAVITVAREFSEMMSSKDFFKVINGMMLDVLSDLGVKNYGTRGISDITIGDRKILGSSMHRRENRLVYHGVLNISEDPGIFERYLKHPGREPDYRQHRKHGEFVTSLKKEGYNITYMDIAAILNSYKDFIVPPQNYSTAYDRQ
jgi:lipoate-protein ligase A